MEGELGVGHVRTNPPIAGFSHPFPDRPLRVAGLHLRELQPKGGWITRNRLFPRRVARLVKRNGHGLPGRSSSLRRWRLWRCGAPLAPVPNQEPRFLRLQSRDRATGVGPM